MAEATVFVETTKDRHAEGNEPALLTSLLDVLDVGNLIEVDSVHLKHNGSIAMILFKKQYRTVYVQGQQPQCSSRRT